VVQVESAPGAGTTVTVLLPLADPLPAAAPGEAATLAVGNETLLVVEDVEPVRRFLVDALTEAGYRVLAAESAEEALDTARGFPVDLLLSDIVMPGLSGTELAERMEAVRPGLRVLLMSGYAEEDLGGRDFILKPFDADDLTVRVREILDRSA
jgi:DNA-binding response OmpR family regulator